ncbi:MAG: hypothetical protein K2I74_05655 [Treponemataceae bacterium]|nr:hypothetical protein [Treponemataceae bacterium]
MAWTSKFAGVDYKKRAEYLHNYLTQRPDGLAQRSPEDPFARGYKDVLSFIVASLCMRSEYRYISEGAREYLKKNGIDKPVYSHVYTKYEDLTNEHTIPVSVIIEHLASLDKAQLTVKYLTDFIEKISGLALITNEEDDALNDNGLRNKLPSGTTLDAILQGKKPHSARYDAAGIKMAETNHGAKA